MPTIINMNIRISGDQWHAVVLTLVCLSLIISLYHLISHSAPLLPTLFGQVMLLVFSAGFGAFSYQALSKATNPSEKRILGSRTSAAFGLGAVASGLFGYHQHLMSTTKIGLDSVLFQATFVAVVAGIAGVKLGLETIRREQARRQLENTIDQLEESNTRLEGFANAVSHDLRNPLNVAIGRIELIRDEHDSDNLRAVSDALQRMERIIEDILWLTREDRDIGQTEHVNLREVSKDAWAITAGEYQNTTLTYKEGSSEQWSQIEADRDRLQQLLENLFRNSIDHGDSTVSVRVVLLPDGFAIEDNGPGIPPEHRERVFESGYTTAASGSGLGLQIVQRVVNGHDWDITVTESAAGGARFEITSVDIVDEEMAAGKG